nr:RHS repeat-associated core domain-containing protein [Photobacterium proteolyticum]
MRHNRNRVTSHSYSPYGTVSGDDFTVQPFGMSTKRSDFTSGLVYFGYRFYMPNLGRWLNRDPLQEAGGINLYAYVNGGPLGYVDPDGRWSVSLSVYRGIGMGATFGYNPNNGRVFGKFHAGVGAETGWNIDPNDNGDEARQKCAGRYDISAGTEAGWGVNVGPYGVGATVKGGDDLNGLFNVGPKLNIKEMKVGTGVGAHVSAVNNFSIAIY